MRMMQVLNKVGPKVQQKLLNKADMVKFATALVATKVVSNMNLVHINPQDADLDDVDDFTKTCPSKRMTEELAAFIDQCLPAITINPENVSDLQVDNFDDREALFREMIDELAKNNKEQKKIFDEILETNKEQIKTLQHQIEKSDASMQDMRKQV